MPHSKFLSTLLIFFVLSGCVSYTRTIDSRQQLDPNVGYIYARLSVHYAGHVADQYVFGLVLTEKNTSETYTMRFKEGTMISVIPVKPGVYTVDRITFGRKRAPGLSTDIKNIKLTDRRLPTQFTVEPRKAYYIGDIAGSMEQRLLTIHWELHSIVGNYDATTSTLKQNYPNFKEVETTSVINTLAAMPSKRYVEPSGDNTATVEIFNNTTGKINVSLFEDAFECKNGSVLEPMSDFEDKVIRIPSDQELAFDITNTFHEYHDKKSVYSCHWTASFYPQAKHAYHVNFYVHNDHCVIQVSERIPASNGDSKRVGVPFDQRIWVSPQNTDGAFCTTERLKPTSYP